MTADEVKAGKPSPESYLLGAEKIGFDPRGCLVFEDTLPGVRAGEAAGSEVVLTNAVHEPPVTNHTSISDFRAIVAQRSSDQKLRLEKV